MIFVLFCMDKPTTGAEIRRKTRAAHLQFVVENTHVFRYGGPLLSEDGRTIGSLMVVDLPDRAALERFLEQEPYSRSGLFESLIVRPSRQVVPETAPGSLAAELEKEKALHANRGGATT